jgi:hypothetical protein
MDTRRIPGSNYPYFDSVVQGTRELDWRIRHDIHCKASFFVFCLYLFFFSSRRISCRPESIADGRHRFYASENFPSEAASLSRISKAANEMKSAVVEFADRGSHRFKKPRTDNGSETISNVGGIPRNIESTPVPQQSQAHSTLNHPATIPSSPTETRSSEQPSSGRFLDFLKNPRPDDKMRNPIANSTISAIPPEEEKTPPTSRNSYIAELSMDKDRMVGFVQQLLLYVLHFSLAFAYAHGFSSRNACPGIDHYPRLLS